MGRKCAPEIRGDNGRVTEIASTTTGSKVLFLPGCVFFWFSKSRKSSAQHLESTNDTFRFTLENLHSQALTVSRGNITHSDPLKPSKNPVNDAENRCLPQLESRCQDFTLFTEFFLDFFRGFERRNQIYSCHLSFLVM